MSGTYRDAATASVRTALTHCWDAGDVRSASRPDACETRTSSGCKAGHGDGRSSALHLDSHFLSPALHVLLQEGERDQGDRHARTSAAR